MMFRHEKSHPTPLYSHTQINIIRPQHHIVLKGTITVELLKTNKINLDIRPTGFVQSVPLKGSKVALLVFTQQLKNSNALDVNAAPATRGGTGFNVSPNYKDSKQVHNTLMKTNRRGK